jgi:hypothetical protein
LTDDTGLDFYLACATSDHSGCGQVQNGSSSVWVQGQNVNGSFQTADVDMNKQGDPSAGYSDQFGNNYSGTFDQNNGVSFTNTATGATSGNLGEHPKGLPIIAFLFRWITLSRGNTEAAQPWTISR